MNRRITVFCSSSDRIDPVYGRAAAELGCALAREGWTLVYGGNALGSMGALADACRAANGKVIGVTPQLFVDKGSADNDCHELIVTPDMRSRKARMEELADGFIALPGGYGTLEELSEILVGRLLKCHSKPLVILDIANFYDPLIALFDRMIAGGFAKEKSRSCYHLARSVDQAMAHLRTAFPAAATVR